MIGLRASLLMMAAQLLIITAMLRELPWWIVPVWLLGAIWHWRFRTAAVAYPGLPVKLLLVALCVTAIVLKFPRAFALEPMVTLLVMAISLKLLELQQLRDYWLVILLSYFLLACGLIFDQSLLSSLLALIEAVLLLMAQQSLRGRRPTRALFRHAGVLALQALPVMLFLFLVFPRIAPLWSVPLPGPSATTGMSESMQFGDIAKLSRSAAPAFRTEFSSEPPPAAERYWRGLVLERFDGWRWQRRSRFARSGHTAPAFPSPRDEAETYRYTVVLEPGVHDWLYTLTPGWIEREDIRYGGGYQWFPKDPLTGRFRYEAYSRAMPRWEIDRATRALNRELPGRDNPRARALGQQWRDLPPAQVVQEALAFLRSQPFVYTLQPPLMTENNVDQFLFRDQRGYCEHFAGSFAFLMRAAGLPARIVVGYQGGEFNEREGYLLVSQSDAHAWVEVWLEDQGWIRVDPTGTVVPERIERGADAVLRGQPGYLSGSPMSLRKLAWASRLRWAVDNMNYAWSRWVVNFDASQQDQSLRALLGEVNVRRLLLAAALMAGLPLALVAAWTLRGQRRRRLDPATQYYLRACAALARRGHGRRPAETPSAFLRRTQMQAPQWAEWVGELNRLFALASYEKTDASRRADAIIRLRRMWWPRRTRATEFGDN